MQIVKVGGITVPAGESGSGAITVGTLSDRSPLEIRFIVVNGQKPGPTLYLGGALHGPEHIGTETIRRIKAKTNPKDLSGTIIAVPVQNPLAFRDKSRTIPGELTDINRIFPGNPDGGLSERIAFRLMGELVSKVDYVVDIHEGMPNRCTMIPPKEFYSSPEVENKTVELAKAFGLGIIMKVPLGAGSDPMVGAAARKGIPAVITELGQAPMIEKGPLADNVKGVENIMKYLKMIEGVPERLKTIPFFIADVWTKILAPTGGICIPKVELEGKVSKGDVVATIYDPYTTEEVAQVKSPVSGYINSVNPAGLSVREGDRICSTASAKE